jgi:hypothetical protein
LKTLNPQNTNLLQVEREQDVQEEDLVVPENTNLKTLNPRSANLLQVEREEDVQEEDLVRPDDALLLGLLVQPGRPLVRHQLVLEAILAGHMRDEILGNELVRFFY